MMREVQTMNERNMVWRERLSAMGSRSLPKSETWLRARATWPSRASESSIRAASPMDIQSIITGEAA